MKNTPPKNQVKELLVDAIFSMLIAFTTIILVYWIFREMPHTQWMIILFSILNGVLFLIFNPRITIKARQLYAGFVGAMTFTVGMLLLWIKDEIVDVIPMSTVIGILLFVAFLLFSSAMKVETKKGGIPEEYFKILDEKTDEELAEEEEK